MKTSKPFSSISYNTPDFLKFKLDSLFTTRKISFYTFIKHFPEEDESKPHIHLIIFPNGQFDTDSLYDYLLQPDLEHPGMPPLGIMPVRSSKWDDWYLYSIHDTAYLLSKAQTRQYHYLETDHICPDVDYLHELVRTIDRSRYQKTVDFIDKIKSGANLCDLVAAGHIPVSQFNQYKAMYSYFKYGDFPPVNRNGGISHSNSNHIVPVYNPLTGEIEDGAE